ncbi:anti-sigma factor antagonist [Paenisporosarcina cavernae]|uniref:Anti-sigma factor antagonist n=1 Tax=Paenisporosarcina cavernae TaxID=2320858 RepID=A0A385YRF0_9BACL|nr:anti-sigma factor antagonist [Paenisporosarcina cavernae]AYC29345.1 STAS domain-containing protein [Paenisporosarcina cavernae]
MAFTIIPVTETALLIRVVGELGNHETRELKKALQTVIYARKCDLLVWDFHQVSFMDSSAIGLILGRIRELQVYGGTTKILCSSPTLKKIFQFSGLSPFVSEETEDQVLEQIGGATLWKTK